MNISAFINPANLQDTPRLFTALAEWLAVFVYFNIYKRRYHGRTFVIQCLIALLFQVGFQFVAGLQPLSLWIVSMAGAVALMYLSLYMVLDIKPKDCGVITTHAFVLAEFAASLYKQLYVWLIHFSENESLGASLGTMLIVYLCTSFSGIKA